MTEQPARPLVISAVTALVAVPSAVVLAAPALIAVEPDRLVNTAASLLVTAAALPLCAALAGAYRGGRNPVHVCMAASVAALLLVGFSTFVALEPVWLRFAAGMTGPVVVCALVAYGAPVAAHAREAKASRVVRLWLMEPFRLLRSVARSVSGRDAPGGSRA